MKFKTQYNQQHFPIKGEKNTLPSMTVPDQTMSVKEILQRYAKGLPLGGAKVPMYEEDYDEDNTDILPDPKTLDLAELEEFSKQAKSELEEIKEKANKKAKEKAEKKAAEDKAKEREEWLKEQKKASKELPGDDSTNNP